jgi:hypothetical protein
MYVLFRIFNRDGQNASSTGDITWVCDHSICVSNNERYVAITILNMHNLQLAAPFPHIQSAASLAADR